MEDEAGSLGEGDVNDDRGDGSVEVGFWGCRRF